MTDLVFKPNNVGILMPTHEVPRLHRRVMQVSFENFYKIRKVYNEIIGLRNISHFSINIVDPHDEMSIISYNPHIAFNICADGSYVYNGSISPTFYKNKEIYSWDETYDPRFSKKLKFKMERKNGIEKGVVTIRRTGKFIILYSFATKSDGLDFNKDVLSNKDKFYEMGDHCFSRIVGVYSNLCDKFEPPKLGVPYLVSNMSPNKNSSVKSQRPRLELVCNSMEGGYDCQE